MGKRKLCIQLIDLFLLHAVDLFNVGIHDVLKARIKKAMQAEITNSCKAAPYFMVPAHARIKMFNAVANCPFNRLIITGIKMQIFNFSGTAPVSAEKPVALVH